VRPLPRREHAPELLDEPDHDIGVLAHSLAHVAAVNRWLGGTRSVARALAETFPDGGPLRILDIGTGSGDLPRALTHTRGRSIRWTAIDLHAQSAALAREAGLVVARADALCLPFAAATFDAALLTLTLHHFDGASRVRVLREAGRVARFVIVSDLRRSRVNLWGARLLSGTLWRGNPLTRHDGPLSVLRAFTPAEMMEDARRAGLRSPRVTRRFFQRLVLTTEGAEATGNDEP
jgi:SAM-dependent methyltransferase